MKKIVVIFIAIILIGADVCIQSNYNYDSTKIVTRNTYTYEDLVSKYIIKDFYLIVNGDYEQVYNKIQKGVFSNITEFENLMKQNTALRENLVSVREINRNKNIYDLKIIVQPPLFVESEKMKLEQYKTKYFNLKVRLDGIFNYEILEFKKAE